MVDQGGLGSAGLGSGSRRWHRRAFRQRLLVRTRDFPRCGLGRWWGGRWPGKLGGFRLAETGFGQGYPDA